MVRNGIDRVKIGVRNLGEAVSFFRDTLEMTLVGEGPLDRAAVQALWQLPEGTSARAAYLGNGEQTTLLELVEWAPASGIEIREGTKTYDHGLLDVAFRAKGLEAVYAEMRRAGHRFLSAPVVYTADWAKVTVAEVILVGPHQMPVALIERLTEPKPFIRNRFGTMVDVAQYVSDYPAAIAFYTGLLGYTAVFDDHLPAGLIDEVVGLPPGSQSRLALLYQPPSKTPAVELLDCSAPGRSLAPVAHPPNLGLFAMAFEVVDLGELARGVRDAGYDVVAGPAVTRLPAHGQVEAAVVRGPNQVLLEFFSR